MIKKILCLVIILATVLSGCGHKREVRKDSASKQEKELCVLYTPENEILIKNFETLYPEYKLEKVLLAYDIDYAMANGKTPDIIIAEGSTPLLQWYKSGIIQDLGYYFGEDESIKDEDYFSGALSVGREEGVLLAMPLSSRIPYMTVRKSVEAETAFGNLSGEYTLEEYLNVLEEEYSGRTGKGTMVVSGTPFYGDFVGLLFAVGAVTLEEGKVEIDQEIFEKLYYICIENCRNYQEEAYTSVGTYRDAAIDPRDGDYKAAYWYRFPPQVGVLYAQSVNRQLLDEDIDVFWWPMAGETGRCAAEITALGMVGSESENPQAAYEVLRLMMDMPMKEWVQPQNGTMSISMDMPVRVENAKALCTYVETNGITKFSIGSTGNNYEFVEKQIWDGKLKEKVLNMLDGIQYVYRKDSSIYEDLYGIAIGTYIETLSVEGAQDCYEVVLNHLQNKIFPPTPLHDGNYFSFSPAEYTTRLGEVLEGLGLTRYFIDSVDDYNYTCYMIDTSKTEVLADLSKSYSYFENEGRNPTNDENAKNICGIITYLNDPKYENLFPLMSAIIMTCDPTLDSKSTRELIDKIPIYDSSKMFEEPTGSWDPYYYNGIGYHIHKINHYTYELYISIAEE